MTAKYSKWISQRQENKFAKISCSSKCHGKSEDAKCTNKDVVVVEEIEEEEKEPTSAVIVKEKEAVEPKKTTRTKKLKK